MSAPQTFPFSLAQALAAAALLLASPQPSRAHLIPILDLKPGGIATVPLANAVAGWQFQVTNPITISALGVWDEGGAPLYINHQIGLWNLNETLLATATVGNGATPVPSASGEGQWLFTPIAPLLLEPGQYVLGAVWGNPSFVSAPIRCVSTQHLQLLSEYLSPALASRHFCPARFSTFPAATDSEMASSDPTRRSTSPSLNWASQCC
jgi:hypothetical protein